MRCNNRNQKTTLKGIYIQQRKVFDKAVFKVKALYWYKVQHDHDYKQSDCWNSIGKISVAVKSILY